MDGYPLLDVFFTTMWVFLWILWFFLLFRVLTDLFRDDEVSGWGKAGWAVFLVVLPFFGVFVYLVLRGREMGRREAVQAQQREKEFRAYVREAATDTTWEAAGPAQELERLAQLKNRGDISDAEYEQLKAKIMA